MHWDNVRYFREEHFRCPCCAAADMQPRFVGDLDHLRALLDRPLVIGSGYRCPRHNRRIGSADGSWHCRGMAVDVIRAWDDDCRDLVRGAIDLGLTIGIGRRHIHLDAGGGAPSVFPICVSRSLPISDPPPALGPIRSGAAPKRFWSVGGNMVLG